MDKTPVNQTNRRSVQSGDPIDIESCWFLLFNEGTSVENKKKKCINKNYTEWILFSFVSKLFVS